MEGELKRYQEKQLYQQPPRQQQQLSREDIRQLVGRDPLQPQARLPGV